MPAFIIVQCYISVFATHSHTWSPKLPLLDVCDYHFEHCNKQYIQQTHYHILHHLHHRPHHRPYGHLHVGDIEEEEEREREGGEGGGEEEIGIGVDKAKEHRVPEGEDKIEIRRSRDAKYIVPHW